MQTPTQNHRPPQAQTSSTSHASSHHARPHVGRREVDPLDYPSYPFPSMRRYAELLALHYDSPRTRHAYYRHLRLLAEHFQIDPAALSEDQFRDYILHVKTRKHWQPKTIRQAAACARLFFVELYEKHDWKVFKQIRAKDRDTLPAVLTREQVHRLLANIRLRRYRIPIKLIYCAGLRLSECLSLTIDDIQGDEGKLWIRGGKGGRIDSVASSGSLTPAGLLVPRSLSRACHRRSAE